MSTDMHASSRPSAPAFVPLRGGAPATADPDEVALARLADFARRETGLDLGDGRAAMIRSRLGRRLRHLGLADFAQYWDHVSGSGKSTEMPHMISALTTNVSEFFREPHHFGLLRDLLLPALAERAADGARVRLWSAGCANGQEPYSIAMTLAAAIAPERAADVRILATDIDPEAVAFARRGAYPDSMLSGLPEAERARHFVHDPDSGQWIAGVGLRRFLVFRELNLIRPWPFAGPFDTIFCRNVMIYFDAPTQARLCRRFAELLVPGGLLCIGHSERLDDSLADRFEPVGLTAFRRTGARPVPETCPEPGRRTHSGLA